MSFIFLDIVQANIPFIMKTTLTILALWSTLFVQAQVKPQVPQPVRIYAEENRTMREPLLVLDQGFVYREERSAFREPIYKFEENMMYKLDRWQNRKEPILTIEKGKIKQGDGRFFSKVIYTVDGNQIRVGEGTFLSNPVVYVIENGTIKLGEGAWAPVLYRIQGDYTMEQIACLLLTCL